MSGKQVLQTVGKIPRYLFNRIIQRYEYQQECFYCKFLFSCSLATRDYPCGMKQKKIVTVVTNSF